MPQIYHFNLSFFIYDKKPGAAEGTSVSNSLFGLDIGGGVNLSDLPLVGKVLPKDASLNFGLQPLIAIGNEAPYFSQDELARISALIPGGGITLPAREINEKISLGIHLSLGSDITIHFDLPIQMDSKKKDAQTGQGGAAAADGKPALNPPAESAIDTTDSTEVATSPSTAGTTPAPTFLWVMYRFGTSSGAPRPPMCPNW